MFVGWIVPLILTLVDIGTSAIGGAFGIAVPVAAGQDGNQASSDASLYAFFAPSLAFCILGCFSMCSIIYTLAVSAARTKTAGRQQWRRYVRLLLFVIVFLAIYLCYFVFWVYTKVNSSAWRANAQTFVMCRLLLKPAGLMASCPGEEVGKPTPAPDVNIWLMLQ